MIDFAALERPLKPTPAFLCEPPDGVRTWTELQRQTAFLREMRLMAPTVLVYANANAGKRNPQQAMREGVRAGVFDVTAVWNRGAAWLEFKGYTAAGRAGALSNAQVDFGNCLVERGWSVACFFTPAAAVAWLAGLGAPVRLRAA